MARSHRIRVRERLRALLPHDRIEAISREAGFMLRHRRLEVPNLAWSLVWGFGVGGDRTLAALYRTYSSVAPASLAESSFADWLRKPEFPTWMGGLVEHALEGLEAEAGEDPKLAGELSQFRDVLASDSSLVRLHASLQQAFPGTRTNHSPASLKVHLVQKVTGSGVGRIRITEGRRADGKTLRLGPWIRDSLLLIDLGYYEFARFARVDAMGGYFVSRVKTGANPVIVESLRNHRGQKVPIEGVKLQEVLDRFQRKVIDLEVTVRFQPRAYRGERHTRSQNLRLVGVWNEEAGKYHLYFTNLSPEQLSAEAIAEVYRLRWQVELLFRALKSIHGLGKVRTLNQHTVTGLVYAAILSLLVTNALVDLIRTALGLATEDIPMERGARVVKEQAMYLLRIVLLPPRDLGRLELDVERTLLRSGPDRNQRRRILTSGYMNLMAQSAA